MRNVDFPYFHSNWGKFLYYSLKSWLGYPGCALKRHCQCSVSRGGMYSDWFFKHRGQQLRVIGFCAVEHFEYIVLPC